MTIDMSEAAPQLVVATQELIHQFISAATREVLCAKAGFFENEATAIVDVANRGVSCTVFMEDGDSAARLGFGDQNGLERLRACLLADDTYLTVQLIERVRMGIFVVDDHALVCFPLALRWEDESTAATVFPNGLFGGRSLVASLLKILRAEKPECPDFATTPATPETVGPFTLAKISAPDPDTARERLDATISKLKANPPPDPTKLRQVGIYTNLYKIIKLTEKHVAVHDKSISLNGFNKVVGNSSGRLKSSWRIFDVDSKDALPSAVKYHQTVENAKTQYLVAVGRHGHVIHHEDVLAFKEAVMCASEDLAKVYGVAAPAPGRKELAELNQEIDALVKALEGVRGEIGLGAGLDPAKRDELIAAARAYSNYLVVKVTVDMHEWGAAMKEKFQGLFDHISGDLHAIFSDALEAQEAKEADARGDMKAKVSSDSPFSDLLAQSRSDLVAYLLREAAAVEQSRDLYPELFQDAKLVSTLRTAFKGDPSIDQKLMESYVAQKLGFPTVEELVVAPSCNFDVYDISSELLCDAEFEGKLKVAKLGREEMRQYSKGYQTTLF